MLTCALSSPPWPSLVCVLAHARHSSRRSRTSAAVHNVPHAVMVAGTVMMHATITASDMPRMLRATVSE